MTMSVYATWEGRGEAERVRIARGAIDSEDLLVVETADGRRYAVFLEELTKIRTGGVKVEPR